MGEEVLAQLTRIIWFLWQSSSYSGYDSLKLTERYFFKPIPLGSSFHAQQVVSGNMVPMHLARRKRAYWSEMLLDSCISQSSVDLHINDLASQENCLLGDNVLICQIKQSNLLDSCISHWKLTN